MAEPLRSADTETDTHEPTACDSKTGSWFKVSTHGEHTKNKVPIFELSSQRMMYVQLSWPEHPNKQKQVFALVA